MAFTKALYYPWIEIIDQAWLKNAMLYWEEIQTIVPISLQNPYSTRTAKEFNDAGLLTPLYVESNMEVIRDLTDPVLKYISSPEGTDVLLSKGKSEQRYMYPDKLSKQVRRMIEIYSEKLSEEIILRLEDTLSCVKKNKLYSVDARFANFYMTLLATNLADKNGLGLLTSTPASDRLSTAVRLDSRISFSKPRYERRNMHRMKMPSYLAQGMLAELIIEKITIDPETSVKNILKFKNRHEDELGRFRTKIDELTKKISIDIPISRLRQEVEDIYINEVRPAINSLKLTLTDSGIKWVSDNLVKVTVYYAGSTTIPVQLGLSTWYALLVGAGVSITASLVSYNRDKAEKLRQNPFSYLITAEKEFQPKGDIPFVTPL